MNKKIDVKYCVEGICKVNVRVVTDSDIFLQTKHLISCNRKILLPSTVENQIFRVLEKINEQPKTIIPASFIRASW